MTHPSRPMSLAVLSHLHHPIREPFQGGLEAHTAHVCVALTERGHEVTLCAKGGSRVDHPGVRVVPVLAGSAAWGSRHASDDEELFDDGVRRACEVARGHDAVLNNTLNPVPYTALPDAAMLTVLHTPAELGRVDAVVQRPGWSPGARHVWVSVSEANATGWRVKLPSLGVGVVHNGLDLAAWSFGRRPVREAVWTGRITPEKGLHVAIEAAARAGLHLDVAGPLADRAYFEQVVAPLLHRHREHVTYHGHLPQAGLARLLADAAVFLATPLWEEPFGLAPLEAMACGTPVAALARGAMPEVVGASGGVLADELLTDRTDALADAALRAATMDRAGVRRHAESFSLDRMAGRYEALLTDLAHGHHPTEGAAA